MKNLFKKMMLVAVAAMAFVACSQDNDEINATVKKTDVVFNLSIEDVTRAYFGEEQGSGSDTSFPSYWSGDESVTLVAYDANDVVVSTAYGSIEAEGEQATQARVSATFEDDLAGVAKVRAYVGSWSEVEPGVLDLSQEQYMEKEGTVASNAHTMSAEAAWDGVAQSIDLNFKHAVAYGRMQIKGLDDVTITKAIVKVDDAEYQVNLSSELDTKYIWFACEADDAIATLDIEVEANDCSYVRTIDMTAEANPLKFLTGQVSKFAVSGLEVSEKPMFECIGTSGGGTDKVIKLYNEELGELWINFYGGSCPLITSAQVINVGQYYIGYGLYFGSNYGQYKPVGFSEFLTSTPNSFTLDVSVVDGKYKFVINADYTNMYDGVVLENATFIGEIPGLEVPDPRTPLDTPEAEISVVGKTITITWTDVEGADSYSVYCITTDESYEQTETSITLEMPEYSTYYEFEIKAVANVSNPCKSSDVHYCGIATELHPDTPITKYTSMYFVEQMIVYPMYGEYCNVFELSNDSGERMTLYVGSKQSTSTSIEVGDYEYTSVANLGYYDNVFQARAYNADDVSVGLTYDLSTMNVKMNGDVYDIFIAMVTMDGDKYYFNCNAPISEREQPVALETPVVSSSVNGNEVVVSWSAINGAANYTVTLGSQSQTVDSTSVTFSDLEYSTTYTVSVVANPADTTANIASEAGTASFTTEADPNAGGNEGGNTPTEDFSNWNYSAVLNTGSGLVTLTDKTVNGRVVEFKLNEVAFSTFYGDTSRSNYFTDVKVNGVAATVTAESWFKIVRSGNVYKAEINMVINGVTYTGVAASLEF